MRGDGRATLVLAALSAATCLVTGGVYVERTGDMELPELRFWLATLAALGGSALGAAGLWQYRGDRIPRLIALIVLLALAASYVAANALALVQASAAGIPQTPRPLHVVGLVVGGALYLVALLEASRAFRARPSAEG